MRLWGSGSFYLALLAFSLVSVSLFLAPGLGAVFRLARPVCALNWVLVSTPKIGFAFVPLFGTFAGIRL